MPQGTASRIAVSLAGLLLAASGLAGCGAGKPAKPTGVPSTTAAGQPRPITLADAKHCPVTLPRSGGQPGISPDAFSGWGVSYGNGTPGWAVAAPGDRGGTGPRGQGRLGRHEVRPLSASVAQGGL